MVLASGAFDGIHAGHVRYLSAAKALCHEGELLIVAVAPDTYIEKAKHRNAYWSQADRVEAIEAIDAVDAAVSQEASLSSTPNAVSSRKTSTSLALPTDRVRGSFLWSTSGT